MLRVVENALAIQKAERQFVRHLKPLADATITVKLGHPGAHEKARVFWSERLGIWFFSRKNAGTRYWNAFGTARPEGGHVAIACEINFPLCGIDRRTGGAFAQDRLGRVFAVHRGKLGGGRKGIGKGLFESRYRGVWEVMEDGDEETPVAVIGLLSSPRFARQVAEFVRKIDRIKEAAVVRPQAELTFDDLALHDEWIGECLVAQETQTGSECDQGLIIRDLAEALKTYGLRSGNDGRSDLLAADRRGRIRGVFQVRTETTLAALRAGVAQLLLNGLHWAGSPLLVLALPRAPEEHLRQELRRLGVELVVYGWQEDRAIFPDLEALLPRLTP